MNIELVCFTQKGLLLGQKLAELLEENGDVACCTACFGENHISLKSWSEQSFLSADALIFVGALGIAVRAIAPYIQHKLKDPAVLCTDEDGHFLIPLLSGHVGGANALTEALAPRYGAIPVITTATDLRGVWAVDVWAAKNSCRILNPGRIKTVSGRLLDSGSVQLFSEFPIDGTPPAGIVLTKNKDTADVCLGFHCVPWTLDSPLLLCPRSCTLGIGCKKGTSLQTIYESVRGILDEANLSINCIQTVASIDLKQQEEGLLQFAERLQAEIRFFTAAELSQTEGEFSSSDFVKSITGVDNVCERAAAASAGKESIALLTKKSLNGVTAALYYAPLHFSF